jgi:hypothetical protein
VLSFLNLFFVGRIYHRSLWSDMMLLLCVLATSSVRHYAFTVSKWSKVGIAFSSRLYHSVDNQSLPKGRYTAFSFYKFIGIHEDDLQTIITDSKAHLNQIGARGTLLVSTEGVNGQFCVSEKGIDQFKDTLQSVNERVFKSIEYNVGHTIQYPGDVKFPFKKLIVKQKSEILTTGPSVQGASLGMTRRDDSSSDHDDSSSSSSSSSSSISSPCTDDKKSLVINWNDSGEELEAADWHKALEDLVESNKYREDDDVSKPLLLDCRNDYESEMGTFYGAKSLNTSIFSDSWPVLDKILNDVPKDQ